MVERLSVIRARLLSSKRVVFPLLTPTGQLAGVIGRRSIMRAVSESRSYATYQEALLLEEHRSAADHPAALKASEERKWQDWHASTVTNNNALSSSSFTQFEDNWLNLRAFSDSGVITAHPSTPSKRLQMLFRRLGISHLCVTDRSHRFLGFVTRRCLIYPPQQPQSAAAQHSGALTTAPAATQLPQRAGRQRRSPEAERRPPHDDEEDDEEADKGAAKQPLDEDDALYGEAAEEAKDEYDSADEEKQSLDAPSTAVPVARPEAVPAFPYASSASARLFSRAGDDWNSDGALRSQAVDDGHEFDEDAGEESLGGRSGGAPTVVRAEAARNSTSAAPLSFAAQHAMFAPLGGSR